MLAEQISDAVITACKDKVSHLWGPFHFLPVVSRLDLLNCPFRNNKSLFSWTTVKTKRFQETILISCNNIIITSLLCECSVTIHTTDFLFFHFFDTGAVLAVHMSKHSAQSGDNCYDFHLLSLLCKKLNFINIFLTEILLDLTVLQNTCFIFVHYL